MPFSGCVMGGALPDHASNSVCTFSFDDISGETSSKTNSAGLHASGNGLPIDSKCVLSSAAGPQDAARPMDRMRHWSNPSKTADDG